jgi:hypothetical protein
MHCWVWKVHTKRRGAAHRFFGSRRGSDEPLLRQRHAPPGDLARGVPRARQLRPGAPDEQARLGGRPVAGGRQRVALVPNLRAERAVARASSGVHGEPTEKAWCGRCHVRSVWEPRRRRAAQPAHVAVCVPVRATQPLPVRHAWWHDATQQRHRLPRAQAQACARPAGSHTVSPASASTCSSLADEW